jgi:RNA polymerase sigma-70 factor (ECF subfamily)
VDGSGNLLLLRDQDRTRWRQPMIARGMAHFSKSAAGGELTEYHLQAGISACHCAAKDYSATDWPRILAIYDQLLEFDNSPVVALNRAVAIGEVRGSKAAIEVINAIPDLGSLKSYHLFYAALGEFEGRLERWEKAAGHFRRSLELTGVKSEQAFLVKRLKDCEQRISEV